RRLEFLGALVLFAATLSGQQPAVIAGITVASSGEPLPGVTVTLTKVRTAAERQAIIPGRLYPARPPVIAATATTDAAGKFSFQGVDAGPYLVRAALAGYYPGAYGANRPEEPAF